MKSFNLFTWLTRSWKTRGQSFLYDSETVLQTFYTQTGDKISELIYSYKMILTQDKHIKTLIYVVISNPKILARTLKNDIESSIFATSYRISYFQVLKSFS